MRWVKELRGDYQGEDIYVVGASPDLVRYPDNFFDPPVRGPSGEVVKEGRIAIALNWSIIAFPECKYIIWYHFSISEIIRDYRPDLLKKAVLPQPIELVQDPVAFFGKYIEYPVFFKRPIRTTTRQELYDIVDAIMAGKSTYYAANKSVSHLGILFAAELGAKRIILVGCPPYPIVNVRQPHAQSRGMWFFYKHKAYSIKKESTNLGTPQVMANIIAINTGIEWLAEALERHDVEVLRHTYGGGCLPVIKEKKSQI